MIAANGDCRKLSGESQVGRERKIYRSKNAFSDKMGIRWFYGEKPCPGVLGANRSESALKTSSVPQSVLIFPQVHTEDLS
jgi:hypothetical protein